MKKSRNFAALVFYKKTNINRKKNCRLKPMDFEMRYIEERKIDEASAEVTIDVTLKKLSKFSSPLTIPYPCGLSGLFALLKNT